MYKNGNFVIYRDKLHLIFKIEQSTIGNLYYLLDVSEDSGDDVKIVTGRSIGTYKSRPRNTRPLSEMTLSQERAINKIERILDLEFNGRSLDDVKVFIRVFMQNSIETERIRNEFESVEIESVLDDY